MSKKQTITFSEKAVQVVEAFRRNQNVIPSFNQAVNTILEQNGDKQNGNHDTD
jgi:hypothetical protein